MAISFTNASASNNSASASSLTYSYTVSGTNPMLWCAVVGDVTNDNVTGVTYAGNAMTLADKVLVPSNRFIYLFYIPNPTAGANNVVVSASASILIGSACSLYANTAITQALGTDVAHGTTTVAGGAGISGTVTTTVNNSWAIMFTLANGETSYTPTGATNRMTDTVTYGYTIGDTAADITPAGSRSITEAFGTGGRNAAGIIASFSPFVASSTVTVTYIPSNLLTLGVS